MYQTIIVGMGPAGLTAAVYAARKKMKVLLLGKEYGGQASWTSEIENYMGFQYISGPELMNRFEEHVKEYRVEREQAEVEKVTQSGAVFTITCKDGTEYRSQTVIIAAGKSPRRLDVPGEKRFTGRGISYCAVCDAPLFGGKKVAVIGGGNSALEAAHDLTNIAEHVYVVSLEEWTADEVLVDKVESAENMTKLIGWNTTGIDGETMVKGVTLQSVTDPSQEKKLEVEGVFIEIGTIPNSGIVKGLLEMNKNKEVIVNCDCTTSVPGAFAAGDITNIPEKQIIVAAGEGAKATLSAYKYLLRLESEPKAYFHHIDNTANEHQRQGVPLH
ncbi:MAG: thioredoxin-disulfide reductase [Firmicutes bacterium]|nr:thioredoxin-disulfide reductase [Bacillota bacterium]